MKKFVTLLLISLALFGCKKGNTQKDASLAGTLWATRINLGNYSMEVTAIEFIDDTNVKTYSCDARYGYSIQRHPESVRNGTYTKSGDKVIFNDLRFARNYDLEDGYIENATITSNFNMDVYYYTIHPIYGKKNTSGETFEMQRWKKHE